MVVLVGGRRDGALDLEGPEYGAHTADSFAQTWNVRRKATSAAELVAKVLLWTYLWEAGLLALFRQGTAALHSRPLTFLEPLGGRGGFWIFRCGSGASLSLFLFPQGSLAFKVRWSNAQAAEWD